MRNFLLFLATAGLATAIPVANAQPLIASNASHSTAAYAPPAEPTVAIIGHISNPDGPLPGAVVTLVGTKQMTVTNAAGEFQFLVPASTRTLQAVVSFAGYADEAITLNTDDAETTATLSDEQKILLARRQQLRFYLKTARKAANRDLREVHRNMR
jgi:CarboxypepD_reg-like domain